jgi:type VI secretion system secreted protein Hcp
VGKVVFKDFKFNKRVDKASPTLFSLATTAKPAAEALLTVRREGANPVEYYKIRMTDVVVSGVTTVAPSGSQASNEVPEEEVTLRFSTYQVSFTPQKPTGGLDTPICSCWNKLMGTGCACQAAG